MATFPIARFTSSRIEIHISTNSPSAERTDVSQTLQDRHLNQKDVRTEDIIHCQMVQVICHNIHRDSCYKEADTTISML